MKTQTLLGSLLAIQVVLALSLFVGTQRGGEQASAQPLLAFATNTIDRIVINDATAQTTLALAGDNWQLPEKQLPANQSRIHTLLDSLGGLQTRWPVVNSSSGRERFEVADDNYQRKLQLYDGDTLLGEYYFGTSPGFRQTHGRRAGEDAVYALAFNNVDLPIDSNDWLDKTLLGVDMPTQITGPDFTLVQQQEQWQLADATVAANTDTRADGTINSSAGDAANTSDNTSPTTSGEASADAATAAADNAVALNTDAVTELVQALGNLRVLRQENAPEGDTLAFEVTTAEGQLQYQFLQAEGKYYVRRSDWPQSFTISQSDYERITGTTRATLTASEATETTTQDGNV